MACESLLVVRVLVDTCWCDPFSIRGLGMSGGVRCLLMS